MSAMGTSRVRPLIVALVPLGIVNIALLAVAAADKSWVAAGIGLLYGPLANLFVAAALLACSSRLPGWQSWSWRARIATLALLAMVGAGIDFLSVFSMTLHGC
jgi:hypothetical protein